MQNNWSWKSGACKGSSPEAPCKLNSVAPPVLLSQWAGDGKLHAPGERAFRPGRIAAALCACFLRPHKRNTRECNSSPPAKVNQTLSSNHVKLQDYCRLAAAPAPPSGLQKRPELGFLKGTLRTKRAWTKPPLGRKGTPSLHLPGRPAWIRKKSQSFLSRLLC